VRQPRRPLARLPARPPSSSDPRLLRSRRPRRATPRTRLR
jgi:hypothetical protein